MDFKSNKEIFEDIQVSGTELLEPLVNFIGAYANYFDFHDSRRDRKFTLDEQTQMGILITERDSKRIILIEALETKGC